MSFRQALALCLVAAATACSLLTNVDGLGPNATCATCADGGDALAAPDADGSADQAADVAVVPTGDVTSVVTWGGFQSEVSIGAQAVTDAQGNIYAVGMITGNGALVAINNGKTYQPANAFPFQSMLAKFSQAGQCQWIVPIGGAIVTALSLDAAGKNLYLAGALRFGPTSIGSKSLSLTGQSDMLVAKVDTAGVAQWARSYGEAGRSWVATSVVVDPSSNVVIGGSATWSSAVTFGSVVAAGPSTSGTSVWGVLASFDANGTPTWARTLSMPANGSSYSIVRTLGLLKNGDVVAGGAFVGASLDMDSGVTQLKRVNGGDLFVAAYQPGGALAWASQALDPNAPPGQTAGAGALTVSAAGDIYLGFDYVGPVKLGDGTSLPAAGYFPSLGVAMLAANGKFLSVKGYPSSKAPGGNPPAILAIRVDAVGDIIIGGAISEGFDFGLGPVAYSGNVGDAFIAKLSPTFAPRWSKTFAAPVKQNVGIQNAVDSIALLPDNSIVAYGAYYDNTKFDGIAKSSTGDSDGFLAFLKP